MILGCKLKGLGQLLLQKHKIPKNYPYIKFHQLLYTSIVLWGNIQTGAQEISGPDWVQIEYTSAFTSDNIVVFASVQTYNNLDSKIRMKNVTPTSFEIMLENNEGDEQYRGTELVGKINASLFSYLAKN